MTRSKTCYLVHTRSLRELRDGLSAEAFAQIQRDEFALLSQRLIGGAGLRFRLSADTVSAAFAGISAAYESEAWDVAGGRPPFGSE